MSIIHEALKKVAQANHKDKELKAWARAENKITLPRKSIFLGFKAYFVYGIILVLLVIVGINYFDFFIPKAPLTKKSLNSLVVAPKSKPAAPIIAASVSTSPLPAQKIPPRQFDLTGVFFSDDKGYALINNEIVMEGDVINGATVKRITLEEVEIQDTDSKVKLLNPKK